MKVFIFFSLISLLISFSECRENPFAPVQNYAPLPVTSKPLPSPDLSKEIAPVIEKAKCTAVETEIKKPVQKVWKTPQVKPSPKIVSTIPKIKKRHHTHKVKKRKHKPKFKLVYRNNDFKVYTKTNYIRIVTNDPLNEDMLIHRPPRLVLDFGNDCVIYETIHKSLRNPYVKTLKIGTHETFYRLTFVLKKNYSYNLKKTSYGYLIKLF